MMEELKNDLKKCKITFDKVVTITDLVDEYKSTVEEINKVLEKYVEEQETKGNKFEKRFLVTGELKDSKKGVFNIIGKEETLKEWLHKLENSESILYSLQKDGGAKKFEKSLKPAQYHSIKIDDKGVRAPLTFCTVNGSEPEIKSQIKPDIKKGSIVNAFAKKTAEPKATVESAVPKKLSPEVKQTTPEEKKPLAKNTASSTKKSINSFFSPGTSKQSTSDKKDGKANGVIKPPTPKKMEDFFKKQSEKPSSSQPLKKVEAVKEVRKESSSLVNTSVQLFNEAEDDEEDEVVESSDEEEKLEALKRDIISSDHEMETEEQNDKSPSNVSTKRRRILDSDEEDEEEPQKKKKQAEDETSQESKDVDEEDSVPQSETYLDEDGFVMTIKNKKFNSSNKTKPVKKSSPPASKLSRKSPTKSVTLGSSASSAKAKTTAASTNKTKQGNIMNFFTKK